jgi:hypothetical protein
VASVMRRGVAPPGPSSRPLVRRMSPLPEAGSHPSGRATDARPFETTPEASLARRIRAATFHGGRSWGRA